MITDLATRHACPDCGIDQQVNKDGTLRKHKQGVLTCTGSGQPIGTARIPRRSTAGFYKDPATGELLRSVTTILTQGSPKEALIHWAGNLVAETAMEHLPQLVRASRNPQAAKDAYDWLRRAHTRKKDERADLGTAVHQIVEAKVLNEPMPEAILTNPEMAPYIANFEAFVADWQITFTASEMVVADYDHKFAGTLDYLLQSPLLAQALGCPPDMDIPGDTKGLPLDTPLPTPTGWTTIGAVQVGDQVLSSNGQPCTVTQKSEVHYRDCYRVTFDDGNSVICDDEHLWLTHSGRHGEKIGVRSTIELAETLKLYGTRQHRVPVAEPLNLPDAVLPVEPYVLGVWLGDGKHTSGEITKPDDELYDNIVACGYEVGPRQKTKDRCQVRSVLGLAGDLRILGVLGNKHIPDLYLRASRQQRLALLQGLMDTDGTWHRTRHQALFGCVDKRLAQAVYELVISLGQRALFIEAPYNGFGKTGTSYRVVFTPRGINPFRMSRKAGLVQVPSTARASRRVITKVERTLTVATQCIAVNSPDRTYLCTEAMIPTHNTGGELDETTYDGGVKGVYPEAGVQMSAYRKAKYGWLRDGTRVEMPPRHDIGVVLHLRPEGYRLYPVRCGDEVFETFTFIRRVAEFQTGPAKTIVGPALVPPSAPARKVA
ncbi:hypothetical protein ABT340_39265 [Streptosporangium sp. NPDC000239]|uniref:hypothetical protein n=1 Tax=Streptosporangium sp. NPDC000239 TaxID=3154248 RepID=UPI00332CAD7D